MATAEETTQKDMLKAAKGGGLKFVGSVLGVSLRFAVGVVITRFLGASDFGLVRTCLALTETLSRMSVLGLHSSSLRFIPLATRSEDYARLTEILRITAGLPTLVGAACGVALYFLAEPIALDLFEKPQLAPALRLTALAIPLLATLYSGEAIARAFQRIAYSVYGMDIAYPVSRFLLTGAVLLAGFGIAGVIAAYIASLAVASLLMLVLILRILPKRQSFRAAEYPWSEIWRQSLPIHLTRVLMVLNGRLELFVLGYFSTMASVGIFAVAVQLSALGNMFIEAVVLATQPLISRAYSEGGVERIRPLFQTVTRWCVMATLPVVASVTIFAEPLLAAFGPEFVSGRRELIILCLGSLIIASSGISAAILAMSGHAKLNAISSAIGLVCTIALNFFLIPRWGILGAALAATGTVSLVRLVELLQVYMVFRIVPYTVDFLKVLAAGVVAAAIGHGVWVAPWLGPDLLRLALGLAALGISYGGMLYLLGLPAVDREVLVRLRDRAASLTTRS